MKFRSRILLAVIAVMVMAVPLFAANLMRGGLIGKFSPSSVQDNPPILAADETFPVSYDLRTYGRVSKIRDQAPWGTCWAFGATAAVESNYLTRRLKGEITANLGDASTVDFSELHMAWYVKNNPDKSRALMPTYRDLLLNNIDGGYAGMPMAYLVRLDGPVLDSELPYLSTEVLSRDLGFNPKLWYRLSNNSALPSYYQILHTGLYNLGRYVVPSEDAAPYKFGVHKIRVTDALYGAFSPVIGQKDRTEVAPQDEARNYINTNYVKHLIMEYGAVEISYEDVDEYHHNRYNSYYYPNSKTINHTVAIIGWDDTFPRTAFSGDKKPDYDGAWLVKNSWGTEWAASGYFWMSYQQNIHNGVAYVVEDMHNVRVYEHDPLGTCDYMGREGQKTLWAANTFKVLTDGETLESIAFYTTENNAACEWQVFYDLPNKPADGPYIAGAVSVSGSGTFPYAGYHTVKLGGNIPLTKGHYVTVVVKFTNSYGDYPVVVETRIDEYSDFALVHDGESWFSADGTTWTDGTKQAVYLDDNDTRLVELPMNACIKLFTNYTSMSAVSDDELTVQGISVKPYPDDAVYVRLYGSTHTPVAISDLKKAGLSSQADFISDSNKTIPDEPVSERVLVIVPADTSKIPSSDAAIKSVDNTPRQITFMLVNTTQSHSFTRNYTPVDTVHPKGLITPTEVQYDWWFEAGYEPDEFWSTDENYEHPVYGPFTIEARSVFVSLDVDNLVYADGGRAAVGAIPKGYYDFVYTDTDNGKTFSGIISLRLAATSPSEGGSDKPVSPDNRPVVGSSSGGCDSGMSIAGLGALKLICLRRKNEEVIIVTISAALVGECAWFLRLV